ncbi:MAG: hypothetical protein OXT65_11260 [Alphaproteobacteria bacterium]|nr:hypothetical protein [Alphaproteobacteria bacterium]
MDTEQGKDKEGTRTKKRRQRRVKEASGRVRQGKRTHLSHKPSLDWRADKVRVCIPEGDNASVTPIGELMDLLYECRSGASLIDSVATHGLDVFYDRQVPVAQFYPRPDKSIITLNPMRPRGDLLNLLIRELRRCWQYHHGALVNPLSYAPDEAVLLNRAQTADTLMMAVRIAWELKLAGENEAWNWLAGSPAADIGKAYELRAQTDFRTLNNGEAARAAYDMFFEGTGVRIHDKRIIHQMLLDEGGYMRAAGAGPDVTSEIFMKLGELPHGRNYFLTQRGRSPVDQAYYTVKDRSNANFLWFIKFERSFHEKEREIIEKSVQLSAEIVDFARWSVKTDVKTDR